MRLYRFVINDLIMPRGNATAKLIGVNIARAERLLDIFQGLVWIDRIATSEKVDGGVTIFGPGVDRKMRLGYDHHARYALRVVAMKDRAYNCGSRFSHRFVQVKLQPFGIVEHLVVATGVFGD